MTVMAPADENECRQMLYTGIQIDGPTSVRYPKGPGPGAEIEPTMIALAIGRAEPRRQGHSIALLAFGSMVAPAQQIAESLDATVINMRFVKPLDEDAVLAAAEQHELLITLEENVVPGGAGEAINQCLASHFVRVDVHNIGLPDRFIGHGSRNDQLADARLDPDSLLDDVRAVWNNRARVRGGQRQA
jgi:1-deoxy-D-xylulose-5-phosphate synthase